MNTNICSGYIDKHIQNPLTGKKNCQVGFKKIVKKVG